MDIPFSYGKVVADTDFTDRVSETEQLINNYMSGTNTVIISPRRWGKSSLVEKAIKETSKIEKDLFFVRLNIFKCETEQEFYEMFAKGVMTGISSSPKSLVSNLTEFLSRLVPKVVLSDPAGQYEISFAVDLSENPIGEDILDLPQQIASKKNRRIVVCIDEFQQVGEFSNTLRFQKILRSHWQQHKDVCYILYGSRKHMMMNIFGEYGSPFYRFGDMMFLSKISNGDWQEYLIDRFIATGKNIDLETAAYLADKVENHPYYVQQLAQYAWFRTRDTCSRDIVDQAFQSILDSLNLQFYNLIASLTEKQRSFLMAICDGVQNFSAAATLSKYKLGTSGNIKMLKTALLKRELIDVSGRIVEIQDPVFKAWLGDVYRKI